MFTTFGLNLQTGLKCTGEWCGRGDFVQRKQSTTCTRLLIEFLLIFGLYCYNIYAVVWNSTWNHYHHGSLHLFGWFIPSICKRPCNPNPYYSIFYDVNRFSSCFFRATLFQLAMSFCITTKLRYNLLYRTMYTKRKHHVVHIRYHHNRNHNDMSNNNNNNRIIIIV